ncbi:hypothetical protein [Aeoliella sp. SH292]|uniref:hypothetical protein n=1 Tax=Aeoliella sp. SH292 TaxID=3454464 RepID=UPI003F969E83
MPCPFRLAARLGFLLIGVASLVAAGESLAISEQLSAAIEKAKAEFTPVTAEEATAARESLATSVATFEKYLVPGSPRGEVWKNYLEWNHVQAALANTGTTTAEELNGLRRTLDRFRSGASGLEQSHFRHVASAIERFVEIESVARAKDQQKFIEQQLDVLPKYIDRYEADGSTRARFEIERRMELFASINRAPELVLALRNEFNHPNLQAKLSENFLTRIVNKPVDDIGPVTDCILGTSIRGTGHTTGSVSIETVPNDTRAEVVIRLNGVTCSETNGYNDPVVICSSGTTPFNAVKRVAFEDQEFWNYPASVSATTSTKTRSVQKQGGGLGSAIIARIGERQVEQKKPQANAIASRHAEDRIAKKLEDELLPKLQDARYEYEYAFKKPLADRNAEPRMIGFSSTDHSLHFELLQAGRGELAADQAPGEFPDGHDLEVRLHETGAANLASAILAGATLSQKTKEGRPKLDVELPKQLRKWIDEAREEAETEPQEDDGREFKPWALTFRRQRPVTIDFRDQKVVIRIHAANIQVGAEPYAGWDIVVTYGMHVQNGGLTLVRDGDIEVIPTAFDPADGGGLNNRQVGQRGVLAKELNRQAEAGRGFPEEIEIPMIDLPENIAEHGPLMLENAASDAGWFSLGWLLPK